MLHQELQASPLEEAHILRRQRGGLQDPGFEGVGMSSAGSKMVHSPNKTWELDSTWNDMFDTQGLHIPGGMVHSPLCRCDNHRHLATQLRQSNILSEGDAGELQGDACVVL
ncbi:hypothetical protein HaLaN_04437, partial [Haematococcus lacustris]